MIGYDSNNAAWTAARAQALNALTGCANLNRQISYSELVGQIIAVNLEPHDPRLWKLIGDLSIDEDQAGRGMISALVIRKSGDQEPGPGFFELAKQLGRDTADKTKCWIEECKKVWKAWKVT